MIRKPTAEELKERFKNYGGSTTPIPRALSVSVVTNQQPVLMAVSLKQVAFLGAMLKQGKHDINETDINGNTPLILAAQMGHAEMVRMLLDAGADVEHRNNEGLSALYIALEHRFEEVERLIYPVTAEGRATLARKQAEEREAAAHETTAARQAKLKQLARQKKFKLR